MKKSSLLLCIATQLITPLYSSSVADRFISEIKAIHYAAQNAILSQMVENVGTLSNLLSYTSNTPTVMIDTSNNYFMTLSINYQGDQLLNSISNIYVASNAIMSDGNMAYYNKFSIPTNVVMGEYTNSINTQQNGNNYSIPYILSMDGPPYYINIQYTLYQNDYEIITTITLPLYAYNPLGKIQQSTIDRVFKEYATYLFKNGPASQIIPNLQNKVLKINQLYPYNKNQETAITPLLALFTLPETSQLSSYITQAFSAQTVDLTKQKSEALRQNTIMMALLNNITPSAFQTLLTTLNAPQFSEYFPTLFSEVDYQNNNALLFALSNSVSKNNLTLLFNTLSSLDSSTLKKIITQTNSHGYSAFSYALLFVQNGNTYPLRQLVKFGINPNSGVIIPEKNKNSTECALLFAINNKYDNAFSIMKKSNLLNTPNKYGMTALMYAAQAKNDTAIKQLLTIQDPTIQNNNGMTALMMSAKEGDVSAVTQFLAVRNSYPQLINMTDKKGNTALYYAVQSGSISTVQALLQSGAVMSKAMIVEAQSNSGLLQLFSDHVSNLGQNLVTAFTNWDTTQITTILNQLKPIKDVISILNISDSFINPLNQKIEDETLLIYAIRYNKTNIALDLINLGVDTNEIAGKRHNETALLWAILRQNNTALKALLKAGVKITAADFKLARRYPSVASQLKTQLLTYLKTRQQTDYSDLDISGFNLTNFDLSNMNFNNANLSSTILTGVNFSNSTATNATFTWTTADNTNFTNSNLSGAVFTPCHHFNKANFSNANLTGVNFSGAWIGLSTITTPSTNPDGVNFSNANLTNANLSSSIAIQSNFSNAILVGANLNNINLSWTTLTGANFSNSTATNATFTWTIADNTNFTNANLSEAVFTPCHHFNKALFINANLTGTNFYGSWIGFTDATTPPTNPDGVYFNYANLTNANLSNALASKSYFSNATLKGANLTNLTTTNAIFSTTSKSNIYSFTNSLPNPVTATITQINAAAQKVKKLSKQYPTQAESIQQVAFDCCFLPAFNTYILNNSIKGITAISKIDFVQKIFMDDITKAAASLPLFNSTNLTYLTPLTILFNVLYNTYPEQQETLNKALWSNLVSITLQSFINSGYTAGMLTLIKPQFISQIVVDNFKTISTILPATNQIQPFQIQPFSIMVNQLINDYPEEATTIGQIALKNFFLPALNSFTISGNNDGLDALTHVTLVRNAINANSGLIQTTSLANYQIKPLFNMVNSLIKQNPQQSNLKLLQQKLSALL